MRDPPDIWREKPSPTIKFLGITINYDEEPNLKSNES